jgi:hypothetical protein
VRTGVVWLPAGAWPGHHNPPLPVVLPEGACSRAGPRAPRLERIRWYGGRACGEPLACAPSTCTPPPGVDAWRVCPQDEGTHLRTCVLNGTPGRLSVGVSEVDSSDALENTTRNIASALRVEIALNTALDEPLRAYELPHLHGRVSQARGALPWERGQGREERVCVHARPRRAGRSVPGVAGSLSQVDTSVRQTD